jgi:glucose/arabinose dehydrogenase/PKD repeat protein
LSKRIGLAALLVVVLVAGPPEPGATTRAPAAVPADFTDELVTAVAGPTGLAFTPDGRLLITTQPGQLRVYAGGQLLAQPALDLAVAAAPICSNSERGLLGVAVDPAFATNRFVYLYSTRRISGTCYNRVSRVTLADSNLVDPATELVLIDRIPSTGGNHNAGDLNFGNDGFLYVSVGDAGCDYAGNSGCSGSNDAARDEHVLLGKILRITKDGAIPATNPFQGADSARCNVTAITDPGKKCRETFAWGLRNPFRFAFDPNTAGIRFFVNDVGQNTWEEIDEGQAAADYGWNVREGPCALGSTTNCGPPPAGMTNPVHAYGRNTGCGSITGGAFVPNGVWPQEYDGTYLFADYNCGKIFRLSGPPGGFTRTEFASSVGSMVHLRFGPYDAGQALYYTNYTGGGQVRRIRYTGAVNRAPTAALTAAPTAGSAPLAVDFDGSGSSDPDAGDTLTYHWTFGDGTPQVTTATPTASHTYQTAATFTASLVVEDDHGAQSAPATVTIDAGNEAPEATIVVPAAGALFGVDEVVTLRGAATDPEDGALPDSSLSWRVLRHHAAHTHPYLPPTAGNDVPLTGPPPEDLAATTNSHLEIQLTATDSDGVSTTVTRLFFPHLVDVTFATSPSGLNVSANGTTLTGPQTVTSWRGYRLDVEAPAQVDGQGEHWVFSSWSDAGAAAHTITTPASPATYTATFVPDTFPPQTAVDSGPAATTAATTATFAFSTDEPGATFECRLDGGAWAACSSPQRYERLVPGARVFEVRASDVAGNVDPSPALRRVRVVMPFADDFDADGDADPGVWRPSNGVWFVRGAANVQLGGGGDVPVPGDFDGNGRAEQGVWRPSTGVWYVRGAAPVGWGVSGDVPVLGDFGGDGRTDHAVWRPSSGFWFVRGQASVQWGLNGDVPMPGDFDGDSRTDQAVWRPSSGFWFVRGQPSVQWGLNGDVPVAGDFNGDGRADHAVWRPSSGFWFVRGMASVQWGVNGDIPVPGDYDGDGRTDLAVWRPSTGVWYIRGSAPLGWGMNGDVP